MDATSQNEEHEGKDLRSLIPKDLPSLKDLRSLVPEDAREAIERLDHNTRELVREHPALAILGAVGLGYFVGRIVARW